MSSKMKLLNMPGPFYLSCTVIYALQDTLMHHESFNFDATSQTSLLRAGFLDCYKEKEREKEREV